MPRMSERAPTWIGDSHCVQACSSSRLWLARLWLSGFSRAFHCPSSPSIRSFSANHDPALRQSPSVSLFLSFSSSLFFLAIFSPLLLFSSSSALPTPLRPIPPSTTSYLSPRATVHFSRNILLSCSSSPPRRSYPRPPFQPSRQPVLGLSLASRTNSFLRSPTSLPCAPPTPSPESWRPSPHDMRVMRPEPLHYTASRRVHGA
jgi:hypothetical protein